LTLYGQPNPVLVNFLQSAGATVQTVLPYILAPASDAHRVVGLIEQMVRSEVDVLVFTSAGQVDRLWEVAAEQGVDDDLRQGLDRVRVAAVGPIVADNLRQRGACVDICPEQGFVMKNLVQHIKRDLSAR
jgi:uroporphyrinogen-III synthase